MSVWKRVYLGVYLWWHVRVLWRVPDWPKGL